MNNWKPYNLEQLAYYYNGMAFKPDDWKEEGIKIIRIEQLNNPTGHYDYYQGEVSENNGINNEDLIFSWSATLKVAIWKHGYGVLNQHLFKVVPKDIADKYFLYYLLDANMEKLGESSHGLTMKHIKRGELEKYIVSIPEIPEQQCIAKILSTADAVIEKTQAAIAKYKAIKQGMLQDLFTRGIDLNSNKLRPRYEDAPGLYKESKLGMIPREWQEKVFGQEVDLFHGHQFRDYDFTEFGIPVVKIGQVKPENVDLSSCSFVAYGREDEFQNEIIRNGDVLMALTGATLGKACLVKGLNGIVLQNYRVGRFEPIIKENDIDKEFLYYLLIAGDLLTQIFNKVNTGAQGNIGKADFEKATFKKPPFKEQQKIAERLKAIDNKLQTEQTYLQKMQSLKKGLMEDLLSGKKQVKISTELKEMA